DTTDLQADVADLIANGSPGQGSGESVPLIDTQTSAQPARRIELDFPLATSNPNLSEVRDERDVIVSWANEWGAIRGRNPYPTYADALARAIIEPDDFTGSGPNSGAAFEIVDRRLPAGG